MKHTKHNTKELLALAIMLDEQHGGYISRANLSDYESHMTTTEIMKESIKDPNNYKLIRQEFKDRAGPMFDEICERWVIGGLADDNQFNNEVYESASKEFVAANEIWRVGFVPYLLRRVEEQEQAADASKHVGRIKDRITFDATLVRTWVPTTSYGTSPHFPEYDQFRLGMVVNDENGNQLFFMCSNTDTIDQLKKGLWDRQPTRITGTVTKHTTKDFLKQTTINRVIIAK